MQTRHMLPEIVLEWQPRPGDNEQRARPAGGAWEQKGRNDSESAE